MGWQHLLQFSTNDGWMDSRRAPYPDGAKCAYFSVGAV